MTISIITTTFLYSFFIIFYCRGLRFVCIHCPDYNLCEKCEAEETLNHPQDHIWKIIEDPDKDYEDDNPCN